MMRNRRQRYQAPGVRQARNRNPTVVTKRQMEVANNGLVMKNHYDPVTFTASPWNTVTLHMSGINSSPESATVTITLANVVSYLRSQLGLPADGILQVRVEKVQAWTTDITTANYTALRLNAFDLVMSATNAYSKALQDVEDLPGRNHFANVGYIWPKTHQQVVFMSNEYADRPIYQLSWRNEGLVKAYLRIMWRYDPPRDTGPVLVKRAVQHPENMVELD